MSNRRWVIFLLVSVMIVCSIAASAQYYLSKCHAWTRARPPKPKAMNEISRASHNSEKPAANQRGLSRGRVLTRLHSAAILPTPIGTVCGPGMMRL